MKRSDLRNRVFIGLMALAMAGIGIAGAAAAFGPEAGNKPTGRSTEATVYDVAFPAEPTSVEGQLGQYTILITTNLPDGTLVDLEYTDSEGGGGGCCWSVVKGVIEAPLFNNHCVNVDGQIQGTDVTAQVIVAPSYDSFLHGPPLPRPHLPTQPDSVIALLGEGFQNLNGPDVVLKGETHRLMASHEYRLPSDTCT